MGSCGEDAAGHMDAHQTTRDSYFTILCLTPMWPGNLCSSGIWYRTSEDAQLHLLNSFFQHPWQWMADDAPPPYSLWTEVGWERHIQSWINSQFQRKQCTMHLAVGAQRLLTRSLTRVAVHRVAKSTLLTALRSTSWTQRRAVSEILRSKKESITICENRPTPTPPTSTCTQTKTHTETHKHNWAQLPWFIMMLTAGEHLTNNKRSHRCYFP